MRLPKTLVVAHARSPVMSGSTTINSGLLAMYPHEDLAYCTPLPVEGPVEGPGSHFRAPSTLAGLRRLPGKLEPLWRAPMEAARRKAVLRAIDEFRPELVLGIYPAYYDVRSAMEAAQIRSIPFAAYLHDTISEGLAGRPLAAHAAAFEKDLFRAASPLFVMSPALADFYRDTRGLETIPLPHIYPEPIPNELPAIKPLNTALWSGSVYTVNSHAVARMIAGARLAGMEMRLTLKPAPSIHSAIDPHSEAHFEPFPARSDLLAGLSSAGVLMAGLDHPDECTVHEGELSTIFSTKVPEYLASGRPLLVHCPESYAMARFMREHGCGEVVESREPAAIAEACRRLMAGGPDVEAMRLRALEAAKIFSRERIQGAYAEAVSARA